MSRFQLRIAIVGPESSGKTYLAKYLSGEFSAEFRPEYAREYLEKKENGYKYSIEDLISIAQTQNKIDDEIKKSDSDIVFFDTENLVLKIWAEDKFGFCPSEIRNFLKKQDFDLYILCRPDIIWASDPLREDEGRTDYLFNVYKDEIELLECKSIVIEGDESVRGDKAKLFIDNLLSESKLSK